MSTITTIEVRRRLQTFVKEHEGDTNEKQQAQQFWRDFYQCFGLSKSSASMFEHKVWKIDGKKGYIDSFIPGRLLVEHKSLGENLEKAFTDQAQPYFHALKEESEKPRYIICCDFATFHLYDLHAESKEPLVCSIQDLPKRADWFMFLADKRLETITEESPINRKAAYQISLLHEALQKANFTGRDLEVFLTRLLFCLFADDTGIFGDNSQFLKLIQNTREDGKDTGAAISELFQVLNQPHAERQTNLDEALKAFEYINGSLFAEQTRIPAFDYDLRKQLIESAELDWSDISPAIFGAMFQGVLEVHSPSENRKETRRELGAHYTSERNILRLINPLFLDDLWAEFEKVKRNKKKLEEFHNSLSTLTFFDPACGCGNFLVIAYRELRKLENEVVAVLYGDSQRGLLDIGTQCRVNVGQFYGIEIDEAAAHIARVALWITDHQMNQITADRFGTTRPTVPLISTPHISHGNSLRTDWNEVLPAEKCSFVISNPPFFGYSLQTKEQKEDMALVFRQLAGAGVLDYVCAWYAKAADYLDINPKIECAFVSTNSISQGEQPAVLWADLLSHGIVINFAHRTFKWNNEGKGVAQVHCVIIGFSKQSRPQKFIYSYEDIRAEPTINKAKNINAYLVDAENVLIQRRSSHISPNAPLMFRGSQPTDGGHLLLSDEEKAELLRVEPEAEPFIKKFLMGEEFINGISRWCLWLTNIEPQQIKRLPWVMKRLEAVKNMRLQSSKEATRKLASTPYLFGEIKQPTSDYLALPSVSSERRQYIPIDYLNKEIICGNKIYCVPNASLFDFAVLQSSMHMAWTRAVCGRLKSDYNYSIMVVYNNFPFPDTPTGTNFSQIAAAAQTVMDTRQSNNGATLADLYDPLSMPAELNEAHQNMNALVDKAYGYTGNDSEEERVAFLFGLYLAKINLPIATTKKTRKAK